MFARTRGMHLTVSTWVFRPFIRAFIWRSRSRKSLVTCQGHYGTLSKGLGFMVQQAIQGAPGDTGI